MAALPPATRPTVLHEDARPGYRRAEWAAVSETGALTIEGQSVVAGGDPPEYEWVFRLRPEEVPKLVTALGGTPGDDVLPLLVEHCRAHHPPDFVGLLDSSEVTYSFWSRLGS